MITAANLMQVGGIIAFGLTFYWVYTKELREKYAIGWMVLASVLLLAGLFPEGVMALAAASRLSYPSAMLFVALAAIYVFSMSVSITLTRHHRTTNRLVQEVALLKMRIVELEQSVPQLCDTGVSDTKAVYSSPPEVAIADLVS